MKIPLGITPAGSPPFKGHVYLSSCETADGDLAEYGLEKVGGTLACFALTAPGDVLQLEYALTSGSADFIDVIVDGIRRFSVASDPFKSEFRGVVKRVLYQSRTKGTRRGGLKNALMQVKSRNMDSEFDQESVSSLVGTIILQAFRKDNTVASADDDLLAERYPDFEQYATWDEVPDHNGLQDCAPATSMEIDLIDGTKAGKAIKEKTQKSYSSDYKPVATIIFRLRTTEELEAIGKFGDIPKYKAPEHITAEQKRAIKAATTPKTKKEDDASSIAAEDETTYEHEHEHEDEEKSVKKAARKTPRDKATSKTSFEEEIEKAVLADQDVDEAQDIIVSEPLATPKKKPTSLQGSPAAPADLAWLKRDLDLKIEEPRSGPALPTAQTTATNPSKSNNMSQVLGLGDFDMADDFDESYDDDLDAAQTTPSRGYNRFGGIGLIDRDVSPFDTHIGRGESVILGASFGNDWEGDASDAHRQVEAVSLHVSQATDGTDIAPLDEVLASVVDSKRERSVDNDDAQVFTRSASLGPATSKTKLAVVIESRALSTPASLNVQDNGGLISQSQISTQSHDSNHEVPTSPVPQNDKVDRKSKKTASTSAADPVTKAKRKSDIIDIPADVTADTSSEPESKKRTPAEKQNRGSVNEAPKQAANTTVKKSAEKRKPTPKTSSKTAEKRKSVSISDTKDVDSPRKSATAPAGRDTAALEVLAAKAKLEAAVKRNQELEKEYEVALLVKDEREKAKQFIEQAEEIERKNVELQAKIAALYGDSIA